jgi:hypothetical protein
LLDPDALGGGHPSEGLEQPVATHAPVRGAIRPEECQSAFQSLDALLVAPGCGCQGLDDVENAAEPLVILGVALRGGGAHFGHVVLEQFHALRQGFVPFREPFEALVDGHGFYSIA